MVIDNLSRARSVSWRKCRLKFPLQLVPDPLVFKCRLDTWRLTPLPESAAKGNCGSACPESFGAATEHRVMTQVRPYPSVVTAITAIAGILPVTFTVTLSTNSSLPRSISIMLKTESEVDTAGLSLHPSP